MNFAIPIDTAVRIVPYLIVYGTPYTDRYWKPANLCFPDWSYSNMSIYSRIQWKTCFSLIFVIYLPSSDMCWNLYQPLLFDALFRVNMSLWKKHKTINGKTKKSRSQKRNCTAYSLLFQINYIPNQRKTSWQSKFFSTSCSISIKYYTILCVFHTYNFPLQTSLVLCDRGRNNSGALPISSSGVTRTSSQMGWSPYPPSIQSFCLS